MAELSPQELQRITLEKQKRTLALRKEYLREVSNPHRHASGEGGSMFDAGIQRFQAMRVSHYEHFRPTAKSTRIGALTVVFPIIIYAWMLKSERDAREQKVRTGQVAYRDRRFKFI